VHLMKLAPFVVKHFLTTTKVAVWLECYQLLLLHIIVAHVMANPLLPNRVPIRQVFQWQLLPFLVMVCCTYIIEQWGCEWHGRGFLIFLMYRKILPMGLLSFIKVFSVWYTLYHHPEYDHNDSHRAADFAKQLLSTL